MVELELAVAAEEKALRLDFMQQVIERFRRYGCIAAGLRHRLLDLLGLLFQRGQILGPFGAASDDEQVHGHLALHRRLRCLGRCYLSFRGLKALSHPCEALLAADEERLARVRVKVSVRVRAGVRI